MKLNTLQKKILYSNYNQILHNRFILYLVLFVSLVNLLAFAVSGSYSFIIIFILVGYLTMFFSKNMMVILIIALAVTNILKYGTGIRLSENFESNTTEHDDSVPELDVPTKSPGNPKPTSASKTLEKQPSSLHDETEEEEEHHKKEKETFESSGISSPYTYDQLHILGNNTADLIATQQKLMENMDALKPLLDGANNLLSSVDNLGVNK